MPDNMKKRGKPDRIKVAGLENHEVRYLAKKYHLSMSTIRKVVRRVGNSRAAVEAALSK